MLEGYKIEGTLDSFLLTGHVKRKIAIFSPEDGKLVMNCSECAMMRWPDGHPPAARRVFRFVSIYFTIPTIIDASVSVEI